jgi:hypothetical protein
MYEGIILFSLDPQDVTYLNRRDLPPDADKESGTFVDRDNPRQSLYCTENFGRRSCRGDDIERVRVKAFGSSPKVQALPVTMTSPIFTSASSIVNGGIPNHPATVSTRCSSVHILSAMPEGQPSRECEWRQRLILRSPGTGTGGVANGVWCVMRGIPLR